MIYNVIEFGAVADGQTLCTKAVQKAVDICSQEGGGIVRFDRGRYVLSTVFLRSNVTIEIPSDTEILGAESYYNYAQEEKVEYPIYQDSSHTYYHPSLFVGIDCENVKITGGGKIVDPLEVKNKIGITLGDLPGAVGGAGVGDDQLAGDRVPQGLEGLQAALEAAALVFDDHANGQ